MAVHEIPEARVAAALERAEARRLKEGGEPPYDGGMEARLKVLEEFAQVTRDRLTRIETKLDQFATKADIASTEGNLKADLHKAIGEQTWKLITWMTGISTALIAATYFIARNVK